MPNQHTGILHKININDRFGHLTVLEDLGRRKRNRYFRVQCDCGVIKEVIGDNIRTKKQVSCGCVRASRNSKPPGTRAYNRVFLSYKLGAKSRGYSFLLTLFDVINIISKSCYYCGDAPKEYNPYKNSDGTIRMFNKRHRITEKYVERATVAITGIDRIDNTRGYELDNCRPCCSTCNRAKLDSTATDFIDRAYAIVRMNERRKII